MTPPLTRQEYQERLKQKRRIKLQREWRRNYVTQRDKAGLRWDE